MSARTQSFYTGAIRHKRRCASLSRFRYKSDDIALRQKVGIALETATWRANPDWAREVG